jgi:hypothetical protein
MNEPWSDVASLDRALTPSQRSYQWLRWACPDFVERSTHKTKLAADEALEDYFATGEVCEGEHPRIVRRMFGGRVRYVIELES